MRYIKREKIKLDAEGTPLDTGTQAITFFVAPKMRDDNRGPADYESQKAVYKALKYLRKEKSQEPSVEVGEYMALEDAWYDYFIHQAKNWNWGINDPTIFEMIESWEQAPDKDPNGSLSVIK